MVALWAAFLIVSVDLARDSLWIDEAWTDWAVQPYSLRDTLERVRADVHPPFYFLMMNSWVRVAGNSVYALRLPSALFGLLGLAATYALGRRWFDARTGLLAVILLGNASFFVYYAREARMYTLVMALATLSTLLYVRWQARPSAGRAIFYALSLVALLYTHYVSALLIVTHLLHTLLTVIFTPSRRTIRNSAVSLIPYFLALIGYLPWLPTFLTQMRTNPNGPLALPLPTDKTTIEWLLTVLTSGAWWFFALPLILSVSLPRIRQHKSAFVLLLLWLLLTPILLLALNAWVVPVYQVRYVIAALPALTLLVAYALRHIRLPEYLDARFAHLLSIFLLACLVYTQFSVYPYLWSAKPPWEQVFRQVIASRNPLEPIITRIAANTPAGYYDRQLGLRRGLALDLSWRSFTAEEIQKRVAVFQGEPALWVALPANRVESWNITSALDKTRHAAYRSALLGMIFYRFDDGDSSDLRFRFGDLLRYQSGPSAGEQFQVRAGDSLCIEINLHVLTGLDGSYSGGLHLVDWDETFSPAGWDEGLGTAEAGAPLQLAPCLEIPAGTPPGQYHLEWVVYKWSTVERLLVIEDSTGEDIGWGDVMMLASVNVLE